MIETYKKLEKEIISQGLCTHCGSCVGLSNGGMIMKETKNGPIPIVTDQEEELTKLAFEVYNGNGLNYPKLAESIFGSKVQDWRIGFYKKIYIGYAQNKEIRRNGASGGILTTLLINI